MRAFALACLAFSATAASAGTYVDLDKPGALEALQAANPEHHRKALDVIQAASRLQCRETTVRQVGHEAKLAPCAPFMVMTSYPPKRHVTFTVEGVTYASNVAIQGLEGKFMPALDVPR